jgi:hypothetical protein
MVEVLVGVGKVWVLGEGMDGWRVRAYS